MTIATASLGVAQTPSSADDLYREGYQAFMAKDYSRAEALFSQFRTEYPNDARGILGLTETLAAEDRMDDAIRVISEAYDQNPSGPLATAHGNLLVRAERYAEAIPQFEKALGWDPLPELAADLHFRMGEANRRAGNLNSAIPEFQWAANAGNAPARVSLALVYEGTGKQDLALAEYRKILQGEPDQPVALNNAAFILATRGTNLEEALKMAAHARDLEPRSATIADTLGYIHLRMKQNDRAFEILRAALLLEGGSQNPDIRSHMLDVLDRMKPLNKQLAELRTLLLANFTEARGRRIAELLSAK